MSKESSIYEAQTRNETNERDSYKRPRKRTEKRVLGKKPMGETCGREGLKKDLYVARYQVARHEPLSIEEGLVCPKISSRKT